MDGTNGDENLLLDSSLLSYVKEQLALLENIPRFEPATNRENKVQSAIVLQDQVIAVHDRVKVYWPNRKKYYFGEVLATDDPNKGSHIIRYEDDHEEVYSWLTGPQPADWDGPRDKFFVLSRGTKEISIHREGKRKPSDAEFTSNKKQRVKQEKVNQNSLGAEDYEVGGVDEGFSLSEEKVFRAFHVIKLKSGSVTFSRLCSFLKRDQASYGMLKEKLMAWVKKHHIFDQKVQRSGTQKMICLTIPTKRKETYGINGDSAESSEESADLSSSESESQESSSVEEKRNASIIEYESDSSSSFYQIETSESEEAVFDIFSY